MKYFLIGSINTAILFKNKAIKKTNLEFFGKKVCSSFIINLIFD